MCAQKYQYWACRRQRREHVKTRYFSCYVNIYVCMKQKKCFANYYFQNIVEWISWWLFLKGRFLLLISKIFVEQRSLLLKGSNCEPNQKSKTCSEYTLSPTLCRQEPTFFLANFTCFSCPCTQINTSWDQLNMQSRAIPHAGDVSKQIANKIWIAISFEETRMRIKIW